MTGLAAFALLALFSLTARAGDAPLPGAACPLPAARLHARLAGALADEIDWSSVQMECEGMPRVDGGIRLRFTGPSKAGPLVVVLGVPSLAEGASAKAVPVNVTLIPAGGAVYGTRGTDKCLLDEVHQTPLPLAGDRHGWQVEARGFCLEPARAINGNDAILMTTFELTGLVTDEPDSPPAS